VTRTLAIRPRRLLLVALVALIIGALGIALSPSSHHGHDATVSAASRASRTTFHDAMRQLWEDHIVWTRMVIVSVAGLHMADMLSDGILAQFPARFGR
jgi:hypothetical protein